MAIDLNLNRIDTFLKEKFGYDNIKHSSKVNESKRKTEHFFTIDSSKISLNIEIESILENNVTWLYPSNPNDNESRMVLRSSKLDSISNDVHSVIENKMFSKDFLSDLINENVEYDSIEENNSYLTLTDDNEILIDKDILSDKIENIDNIELEDNNLVITFNKENSPKKRFELESEFNSNVAVESVYTTPNKLVVELLDFEIKEK